MMLLRGLPGVGHQFVQAVVGQGLDRREIAMGNPLRALELANVVIDVAE